MVHFVFFLHTGEGTDYKKVVISKGPPLESLNVDIKKVTVVFEIQEQKYCVPRLCIKTAVSATVHDWSKQVCSSFVMLRNSYMARHTLICKHLLL